MAVRVCEAVLGRIRNEAERGSTRGATPPWIDMREEVVRLATAWDTEQELVRQAALEGDGLPPWVDGGTLRGKRR